MSPRSISLEVDNVVQIAFSVPRRFIAGLVILVGLAVAGCTSGAVTPATAPNLGLPTPLPTALSLAAAPTAVPTLVPPPVPRDLLALTPSSGGAAMNWTRDSVTLSAGGEATDGETLSLEVEAVKAGQKFLGKPVARGANIVASGGEVQGKVTLTGLMPGHYIWQARFVEANGDTSSWIVAPPSAEFAFVGAPPKVGDLAMTGAHGTPGQTPIVGASDQATLNWQVQTDVPDSVDTLVLSIDDKETPPSTPPADAKKLDPTGTPPPLPDLKDGTWFAHVWAIDRVGQTSAAATLKFTVQRTPLTIGNLDYRSFVTNPRYQDLPIHFTLSHPAEADVSILTEAGTTPVRTLHLAASPADKPLTATWDGKDASGQFVPAGSYRFEIQATDAAGNTIKQVQTGLTITNKVIVVTLANESLRALDGDQLFLTTPVTSGGQELPTRKGQFEIEYKAAPFVFHSPYPRGSRFWYPDTPATYAMLFDPAEGNFIHDAPWRTVFGPGTDGPGTPGYSIYAGSHGCVELPTSNMSRLFAWTPPGTPVIVQ